MKRKQSFMMMLIALLLFSNVSPFLSNVSAVDITNGVKAEEPILRSENQQIGSNQYTNLNSQVNQLKELDEGTIVTRFRHTGDGFMSLFSLSNNTQRDGHFHLYITPNSIGSENRINGGASIHVNKTNLNLQKGEVYTLAMVVSKTEGYKYFLDGELVHHDKTSAVKFLNNIQNPNSAQLGRTERGAGGNPYPFTGDIDFAEIYSKPLSDEYLIELTGETASKVTENPLPADALITDPIDIFYSGFMGSKNYRIPALLYTKKGTLISGIDRRVSHGGDSPSDIDSMIRRSFDDGDTWEDEGIIVNQYPDQASNIDMAMMQDETSERIFLLVTSFPDGAGLMGGNSLKGTGYKEIDGKKYLYLTDKDNKQYTIREGGKVYLDETNELTDYVVEPNRDLYKAGEKIDNIFSRTTPLKPFKTSYLEIFYSDDEGETWSDPLDISDQTKEEWMAFLGTGPGNGIQIQEGEHKGRILFPVYFFNDKHRQASALVYSDDNGETWHRGESPNEGRNVGNGQIIHEKDFTEGGHELTESQVVELPGGQLKLFMRNHSGRARVATSLDGGETWLPEVEIEDDLVAPYSQMTAIRYNGKIDDKEAVIFASANNPTTRINGAVRIGLIEEDGKYETGEQKYRFDWKYEQHVKDGDYGYSNLTNLSDGNIGLHYEGTWDTDMSFIKFNTEFLKWDRFKDPEDPVVHSFGLVGDKESYRPGEKVQIEADFDEYIMLAGKRQLVGKVDGKEVMFELVGQTDNSKFIFEGKLPNLSEEEHELSVTFGKNLNIYNVFGKTLNKADESASIKENIVIKAGEEPEPEPEPEPNADLLFDVSNQQIGPNYYTNLNDHVNDLKGLDEGAIVTRFRYTPGSDIMSLFSLSNSDQANEHFHLYITPNAIGSENRLASGENTHVKSAGVSLKSGAVYTLAMVVSKDEGYKYFLDGKLIHVDKTTPVKFLSNITGANSAQLGRTVRSGNNNNYPFTGDFDFAQLYSEPLSDEEAIEVTKETVKTPQVNPVEIDSFKLLDEKDTGYEAGDKLRFEVSFKDYVMLAGPKQLVGTIEAEKITFDLVKQTDQTAFIFEGELPNLAEAQHELSVTFNKDLGIYNVDGKTLNKNDASATLVKNIVVGDPDLEPEEVDVDALVGLIESAKEYAEADYTASTFATLQAAIAHAEEAVANATTQAEIVAAIEQLETAIAGLEESGEPTDPEEVDVEELVSLIESAKGYAEEDYTASTFAALQAAIANAEEAVANATTQVEIVAAIEQLETAIAGLEEAEEPTDPEEVVTKVLEDLIGSAKEYAESDYTASTFAALQAAIANAEKAVANATTQAEIVAAIEQLETAIADLEEAEGPIDPEQVDVSALEKLIKEAQKISNKDGKYTADSYDALQLAIKDAENALASIKTEADVDAAVKALEGAIAGLKDAKKSANPVDPKDPADSGANNQDGGKLPGTATPIFNMLLAGFVFLLIGGGTFLHFRKTNASK